MQLSVTIWLCIHVCVYIYIYIYTHTHTHKLQLSATNSDTYKGVAFNWVVQYWLHLQLLEASKYCESKGVILKGDLPIGVDHDSVDAW
jgi:4-alpha-glucanotransferase